MPKEKLIEQEGVVLESLPNVMFRVQYTYEVTRHEYSVGWGINDSGEVVCTKYELVSEKDIDPYLQYVYKTYETKDLETLYDKVPDVIS